METLLSEPEAISASSVDAAALTRWQALPIAGRLEIVRELRHLIAENADALAAVTAAVADRPLEEKLVSEVLPLADACRWLEREATRILAPRRRGFFGRPLWMQGVSFEVQRQPFGVVLVIGPGNYPLFLPAIHALHALVAGNAVLWKPAPKTLEVALSLGRLATQAGLDPALLKILPESVEAARAAMTRGVDKVIFTGSSQNGRDVLATLAESNTPSIMELSGQDPVIVLADADVALVVRALGFGTRLNAGNTCMAPRRLLVAQSIAGAFLPKLEKARLPQFEVEIMANEDSIIAEVNAADFALGASIFSKNVANAQALAAHLKTGFVLINDLIAPTADPRMPFSGVKASGFGTTRGDEGLLEMTFPHVVATRRALSYVHLDEIGPKEGRLFKFYIRLMHGRNRLAAIRDFLRPHKNNYPPHL